MSTFPSADDYDHECHRQALREDREDRQPDERFCPARIDAIQLDAFRAGMTYAAQLLTHQVDHEHHLILEHAQHTILSARDNLTELPKLE